MMLMNVPNFAELKTTSDNVSFNGHFRQTYNFITVFIDRVKKSICP